MNSWINEHKQLLTVVIAVIAILALTLTLVLVLCLGGTSSTTGTDSTYESTEGSLDSSVSGTEDVGSGQTSTGTANENSYTATVVDENGEVLDTVTYTDDDEEVSIPDVPEKEGYDGEWADYELTGEDIVIAPVYTPIVYTATFKVGDTIVSVINYTIEDSGIVAPAVPTTAGYTSSWESYTLEADNIVIQAIPTTYTATFMIDGVLVREVDFTIEDDAISEPSVPTTAGYTGEWESYTIAANDMTINAELQIYTLAFKLNDSEVEYVTYTIKSKETIEIPEVPTMSDYTSAWSDYTLCSEVLSVVYPVYTKIVEEDTTGGDTTGGDSQVTTPVSCNATFMVGADILSIVTFDSGDTTIAEPTITKEGYTGEWADYTLGSSDIIIKAIPTTYTATFMIDIVTVKTVSFTIEDASIVEPAVPALVGYTGEWEEYTIAACDLTVNAELLEYTLAFKISSSVIEYITYTVEDYSYEEPDVPAITGYTCAWSSYTLFEEEVIVITPIYTALSGDDLGLVDPETGASAPQISDGTLIYELNSSGTEYTVVGIQGSSTYIQATIPSTYNNIPVTTIGAGAFENCTDLVSVIVADSITVIESYAFFNCTGLISITFGTNSSLKNIKTGAFANCTALTELSLPATITALGSDLLLGCNNLVSITLPFVGATLNSTVNSHFGFIFGDSSYTTSTTTLANSSVPSSLVSVTVLGGNIDEYAFNYMQYLTDITLINVGEIGASAFAYCTNIVSAYVDATALGSSTFSHCYLLSDLTLCDSLTEIATLAFSYCTSLTDMVISNNVTSIGQSVFDNCSAMVSLSIPFVGGSIKTTSSTNQYALGYYFSSSAFGDTTADLSIKQYYRGSSATGTSNTTYYLPATLTDITITGGVINDYVFYACSKITTITIAASVEIIGEYAFYNCTSLESVYYLGTLAQWSAITFEDELANPMSCANKFYIDNKQVTEIVANDFDGVETIGDFAFYGFANLTNVVFSDDITSIGESAFEGCSSVMSIVLGENVSVIDTTAFGSCTSLYSIYLDNALTSIGSNCFTSCTSLEHVYIDSLSSWCHIDFQANTASPLYNDTCVCLWINGENVLVNTEISLPSTTNYVGSYTFYKFNMMESLYIPSSVDSIYYRAFYDCTNLIDVTMFNGISTIESQAFYSCDSLTSVEIPSTVTEIGTNAFMSTPTDNGLVIYAEAFTEAPTGWITYWNRFTTSGSIYYTVNYATNNDYYYDASDVEQENALFTYVAEYFEIYITGYLGTDTEVVVPDTIDGYPVVSIGATFDSNTTITKVTLPNTIRSIGAYAFYNCTNLAEINMPTSLTTVGSYAFYNCQSLIDIAFSSGIESIGAYAFYSCDLLEEVLLSFVDSSSDVLTTIGNYAFAECPLLEIVDLYDVCSIGDYAFYNNVGLITLSIGDYVATIGASAFAGNTSLTSVILPATLQSISDEAFLGCETLALVCNLSDLDVVMGADTHGYVAYYALILTDFKAYLTITDDGYIIYENPTNTDVVLVKYIGDAINLEFTDNITMIGNYAFYENTNIESVVIPSTVEHIGNYAFAECSALETVTFVGSSNTTISEYAFYNCDKLTSLAINNGASNIGDYAFANTSNLTTVDFTGVEEIGNYAFSNSGLTEVVLADSITTLGTGAFYQNSSLASITIGTGLAEISSYAFAYSSITALTIPSNITSLGSYAFSYCTSLSSSALDFGTGLSSIGTAAFKYCTSLVSITLPNNVKTIGSSAFSECTGITSFNTGSGVTRIETSALMNCTKLSSMTIGSSVEYVGSTVFSGCTSLTSLYFPASVTYIGDCPCAGSGLSYVSFGDSSGWTRYTYNSGYYVSGYSAPTVSQLTSNTASYWSKN